MSTSVADRVLRSNWGIDPPSNGRRLRPAPSLDEYAGDSDCRAMGDDLGYDPFSTTTPAVARPATTEKPERMGSLADSSHTIQANAEGAGPVLCEPLIDAERAGQILKLHPKTVKRLVQGGQLPGFRIGRAWRFRESSLDQWMRSQLKRSLAPLPR
jgi:excisionase family DNA binding protein